MSFDNLISKQELLVGMPAKRTKTLLFLVEKQTALLAAKSRVVFSLTNDQEHDRSAAFLQAFTLDNRHTPPPTIQQLERFAEEWSLLVPKNPRFKAALLHTIAEKYRFEKSLIPNIYRVLDCEHLEIYQAYTRLYQQPIITDSFSPVSLLDRFHWLMYAAAQKLESLPSFWLATLVTIALGLPQAFLALPIAVAEIGPLLALILLILLGGINILTMICMAEAISRSQDFRSGKTFIKQLAGNYLGNAGSLVLSVAVGIRVFLIALACYIGLSTTMANFSSLPATLWAGILFLLGLYLLSRQSLNLTLGFTILLAVINIGVLLVFCLLCFNHWQLDNLLYVNKDLLQSNLVHPQILHRFLGVTLMLYFGHVYVGECAKIILPKDPSANSLIKGSIAGTVCLTFLFCLWILAVNGAIAPEILASQTGTVLEPIIAEIGSKSTVLGAILTVLLLGMAWWRSSSLLVNLAKEWIRVDDRSTILNLTRQQERIVLQTRDRYDCFSLGITYVDLDDDWVKLGLDLQLNGNIYRENIKIKQNWSIKELFERYPQLNFSKNNLDLKITSIDQDNLTLRLHSSMALSYQGKREEAEGKKIINRKRAFSRSYWQRFRQYLVEQRRFLLSVTPLLVVFLLTEGLFLSDRQSFTSVLGFAGVLGNSLVGGIFPVLLLIASRRKGEILPGKVTKFFDHPMVLGGIYSFSLLILLLHGLFIWEHSLARISALSVTVFSLGATVVMLKTGAFIPRTVVEIRENSEQSGQSEITITSGGKPKIINMILKYETGNKEYETTSKAIPSLSSLRYVSFQLPTKKLGELRVWIHPNNRQDDWTYAPPIFEIHQERKMQFDLKLFGGNILLPLSSQKCWCKLHFTHNETVA